MCMFKSLEVALGRVGVGQLRPFWTTETDKTLSVAITKVGLLGMLAWWFNYHAL